MTYFGGRRVEFHLPVDKPQLLLGTPSFDLFGTTFHGAGTDQWVKELMVSSRSGESFLE